MRRKRSLLTDRRGAAAIEFAILAPVFFMVVFSMIGYGIYLSASHAVQQLTADAARTAIAGLTPAERKQLAEKYVKVTTPEYAFLDDKAMTVAVQDDPNNPNQFTVSISYDASGLPIWQLYSFAMPGKVIRRFATIRVGGI
ncbi:pilus assembly protein [Rhizobium sp. S95]|uniref:Pilus assembly protein n=1 Tax=Ciceribacter sichuanensis TaxID=2949647 RepID=A0AAJ1F6B2_9HYPH|nr:MULTISPECIES: TadE/TadG family type IV pilus assembly protein [unclassified Ciceribacter]MCM2399222.1 pilus assembly protein [Ciceribacter sp. S95]MCM2401820.1 pilus assembly protein [Ciceribacter sp. S153]MCO5956572.1 pilus assembly protein [Ciceribacter sp. S101]